MRLTRNATLGLVFVLAFVMASASAASAQTPPAGQQAPAQQQAAPTVSFSGDSALVLNYVKTDKTTDLEAVMAKVKEALQKSQSPERKQQAAGWKVFRSPENAGEGQVLYVFVIDPVVKGADYSVGKILSEGFPTEANDIFKKYADAYGKGRIPLNLNLVLGMGQ